MLPERDVRLGFPSVRLNFRQIEAFKQVVLAGSITGAAQHMHLSQPAVSRLVADLEARTGLKLFERKHKRVLLTHEGRLFFGEVEKAFISLEKIAIRAVEIRELRMGTLKLAAMPALSFAVMPSVITAFNRAYPDIGISLQIRSSERVFEWLSDQLFDLGLAALPSYKSVSDIEMIEAPPCVCVVPARGDLARRSVLGPGDLEGLPFISLGGDSMLRKHIDTTFQLAGVTRKLILETPMSLSALQFVQRGLGVAIIDPFTAGTFARGEIVAKPFEPEIPYEFGALFPTHKPRSTVAAAFLDSLKREIARFFPGARRNGSPAERKRRKDADATPPLSRAGPSGRVGGLEEKEAERRNRAAGRRATKA